MQKLIAASGLPEGSVAPPVFDGPGRLRQRLEAGEVADVFAAGNLAQPRAVARNPSDLVLAFARDRLCLASRDHLGITADNLLERILAPELRLAISAPVPANPLGNYTLAVFARAEAIHPGAQARLNEKALVFEGPGAMPPLPGHSQAVSTFLANRADAIIVYCSGSAGLANQVPSIVSTRLPDALEVRPVFGLALLSRRPEAARLALFILSETGQAILAAHGFLPLNKGSGAEPVRLSRTEK
jgi:ABC-type molybdate transport system substrate-binding protein